MSSMDDSMVDKRRQSLGDTSQFAVREREGVTRTGLQLCMMRQGLT